MCKEDVRIGRAKTPGRLRSVITPDGNGSAALPGNPNRSAVVVCLLTRPSDYPDARAIICQARESGTILGTVSISHPYLLMRVEDYGDGVMGPIWVIGDGAGEVAVSVQEIEWLQELKDL